VLAGGLWRTHADPNQLENIVLNLAVNARDAMPEGGRLTIETQNAHLDDRYAAAHFGLAARTIRTHRRHRHRRRHVARGHRPAFEPFFTTKEIGKGTGLGLSQVYGFVKQTGGHVKIYSEPGRGTTIKIYLPRLVGDAPAGETDEASIPLALGDKGEVILVVEDEPAVRQFSAAALSELGYHVIEADCAAAALRLLEAHPEIVLMFTDIVMPDVGGAKLAEEARRRWPGLKVLFTTGYTRNAIVHNGVLDPGVDLIGKPFTVDALAEKMRSVLEAFPT
jgi:CheY-like chemotaxis protein